MTLFPQLQIFIFLVILPRSIIHLKLNWYLNIREIPDLLPWYWSFVLFVYLRCTIFPLTLPNTFLKILGEKNKYLCVWVIELSFSDSYWNQQKFGWNIFFSIVKNIIFWISHFIPTGIKYFINPQLLFINDLLRHQFVLIISKMAA